MMNQPQNQNETGKLSVLRAPTIGDDVQRNVMQKLDAIRKALEAAHVSGVIVEVQIKSSRLGFELKFPMKIATDQMPKPKQTQ